jgi:membrane protease YdiL (CAAX protease family)
MVVSHFLGLRNYIFIFWAVLPVIFSWFFGRLWWISPPRICDLIFVPIGLISLYSMLVLEYWYRMVVRKDEALIKKLKELTFTPKGWLLELCNQLYYIGLPEEFISRGFLITFLMDSLGGAVSILISSILFGLCHLRSGWLGDLLRALCTGAHSLIYGSIFIMTGSVWITVTIHILINLFPVPEVVVKAIAYKAKT